MKFRRWLYLAHRWLGMAMCLLIGMWFFSGVVMMYVGFPELSRDERLAGLSVLDPKALEVGPDALLWQLEPTQRIAALRLTAILGRPAWLVKTGDGNWRGMFADTGQTFSRFTPADAILASEVYASASGTRANGIEHQQQLDMDQWSVSSSLHPHRPLHRVKLNSPNGTELYISSTTGEVLRDTTTNERLWNWLGANLHWIYPFQLRRHVAVWHWLIVTLSLAGLTSLLTGAVVGLLRLRLRKRYRGTDITPYRGAMKFHHILGLVFLLPLTTYLLSGLLSMNPWGIFSDDLPFSRQLAAYRGGPTAADALAMGITPISLHQALGNAVDTREILWDWLGGTAHGYILDGDGNRHPLAPSPGGELAQSALAQLQQVMAGYPLAATERLDAYDSYYYSHHQRWRPLPVLRVRFDDPASSWFHIDLTTGELINRLTARGRVQRWLYNGLHSLDFRFLINRRPLWDTVVIALCSSGFLFSSTSIIVAWRRLRPRHKARGSTPTRHLIRGEKPS
tara:strand:- start:5388 stop:6914 length:1527 start_codon:yes stop_codon:yes gene_type:complete